MNFIHIVLTVKKNIQKSTIKIEDTKEKSINKFYDKEL